MYTSDTLIVREAKISTADVVSNKSIQIGVGGTLPLIITLPSMITELTLGTSKTKPTIPAAKDIVIVDPAYEDATGEKRYILLTVAESPLTGNRAIFYYDKLFNDILVLPNIAFFNIYSANFTYKIGAYRIGSGVEITKSIPHQTIPTTEIGRYVLPEVNENIANTCSLVRIPGHIPEHLLRNNAIEEMITDKLNLVRNSIQPTVIINLGAANKVFKTVDKLPLYLLSQGKLTEYSLEYINNVDPGTNDLFISLTF